MFVYINCAPEDIKKHISDGHGVFDEEQYNVDKDVGEVWTKCYLKRIEIIIIKQIEEITPIK